MIFGALKQFFNQECIKTHWNIHSSTTKGDLYSKKVKICKILVFAFSWLEAWVLIIFAWKKQFWKFQMCFMRFQSQNYQNIAQRAKFCEKLLRWPNFMILEQFSTQNTLLRHDWQLSSTRWVQECRWSVGWMRRMSTKHFRGL